MRSSVGCQINSAGIVQISEVPDTAGTAFCGPTRHVHTMNVVSMHETHSVEISVLKLPDLTEKKVFSLKGKCLFSAA